MLRREGINSKESFNALDAFARELYEKLNVPIGIIGSSWEITRVGWTSPKSLNKFIQKI